MLLGFSSCNGGQAAFAARIRNTSGFSGDNEIFSKKFFYCKFWSFYPTMTCHMYGLNFLLKFMYSTAGDDNGSQSVISGYGFSCFLFLVGAIFLFAMSIHVSPFICGSANEKRYSNLMLGTCMILILHCLTAFHDLLTVSGFWKYPKSWTSRIFPLEIIRAVVTIMIISDR